jgi:hypothetical protein
MTFAACFLAASNDYWLEVQRLLVQLGCVLMQTW